MNRSDEYWLDLEDRKARGDLRAYGLADWLRIVLLLNAAQLVLVLVVVMLAGVGGLAVAGGVIGLGPVSALEHSAARAGIPDVAAAPRTPDPVGADPVAADPVGADAACRAFCAEGGIQRHQLDLHGCCLCVDALGDVVRSMPAPP